MSTEGRPLHLVMLGDGGVGKSALLIQLLQKSFVSEFDPTICDLYRAVRRDHVGRDVVVEFMDISGLEEYHGGLYKHDMDGAMIVYAINRRSGLDDVFRHANALLRHKGPDFPIVIAGNMLDLAAKRAVSVQEGRLIANTFNAEFFETSAKAAHNVEEAFTHLIRRASEHVEEEERKMFQGHRMALLSCLLLCSPLPVELIVQIDAMVDWACYLDGKDSRTHRKRSRLKCILM